MICPVCSSTRVNPFLFREGVPVHQNLVIKNQKSAIGIAQGNLLLKHCVECDFVFNSTFDPTKLSYGEAYDNTQELSGVFHTHISELAEMLIEKKGVKNCRIVEVGCGKGGFLKLLTQDPKIKNSGFGFDPTYVGEETLYEGHLRFEKSFYDERAKHLEFDVVICRHVIEHIPNPVAFLQLIKHTLVNSPKARLFFETPCLEWILRNQVVWDFFYEHCSYFTKASLQRAFELAGFKVESIGHVFQGQYLWLEASMATQKMETRKPSHTIAELIKDYVHAEEQITQKWKQQLKAEGKVALWGAGAKGVTFANLIDKERNFIDCVIDINPNKQHYFIPGSGHPIVSYAEAAKRGVKRAMIMNANYKEESRQMLEKANIEIELI